MKKEVYDPNQLSMDFKALRWNSEALHSPKPINGEVCQGQLPLLPIGVFDVQETEDGNEIEGCGGEMISVGDLLVIYSNTGPQRYEVLRVLENYEEEEGEFDFLVLADKRDKGWRPNRKVTFYGRWKENDSGHNEG